MRLIIVLVDKSVSFCKEKYTTYYVDFYPESTYFEGYSKGRRLCTFKPEGNLEPYLFFALLGGYEI